MVKGYMTISISLLVIVDSPMGEKIEKESKNISKEMSNLIDTYGVHKNKVAPQSSKA